MSDNNIKMVVIVVDYSKGEKLRAIYDDIEMPISIMTHGHGSASSEILDYLGIGERKKVVSLSLVSSKRVEEIFKKLDETLNMTKAGYGIAFCINVKSMSAIISRLCDKPSNLEGIKTMEDNKFELILTVVTKGCFDDVMEAAKANGASGGTLIHARGLGTKEAEKFLGITIQPEKDLVMIVVPTGKKQCIMEAITKAAGLNTEGKGICFSVPVDGALGISNK